MLYVLKGHKILDVIMCGTIFVCCVALFPSFDFIVSLPGRRRDHMKAHSKAGGICDPRAGALVDRDWTRENKRVFSFYSL
jgi:hypothetical protein